MYLKSSFIFLVGLLVGCSHFEGHHNEPQVHHDGTHDTHDTHAHPTPNADALNLSLNGNQKWLMDTHTRTIISEMQNRFSSINLEQQSQHELSHLGDHLSHDLKHLIRGCKMEGKAHDALHDFLTSSIPAIEELKTTGSVSSAKHVENLLLEYQLYFK